MLKHEPLGAVAVATLIVITVVRVGRGRVAVRPELHEARLEADKKERKLRTRAKVAKKEKTENG